MPERSRPAPVARRQGDCGMRGGSRESVAAPAGSVQERVPGRPSAPRRRARSARRGPRRRPDRPRRAQRALAVHVEHNVALASLRTTSLCRSYGARCPPRWASTHATARAPQDGGTAARRRREHATAYFRRVAPYSVYRVTPGTSDHPRGALDPCALIRGGDPRDVWSGVVPRRPVAVHPCGVRRQLAVTMAITSRVPMGRLPRAAPPSGPANPEAVHAF